ncbi:toll-Interleukin receptor [Pseudomonas alliivorans]|nr:toll-Interleukin receptor [Pseudomonas alliivorans]MEE4787925.1 toll-Interleukin receptor [Pseudomonas alliivorans]MEE4793201.1 toll-Interleukin receptor [Pseudomonas alliivorans]MEE4799434.1 toll-Interleukin receptor [Pseudomonas alliivorans]MEE4809218.1 toll-Interleukin receptor [Pseudomonas alliivorans]
MTLFIEADLRARAARGTPIYKSASITLEEHVKASAALDQFDIFLSHSFSDQALILGIVLTLEDMGYKVYVDWIHDRHLNRDRVSSETARVLRQRMMASKSLFFATTTNSSTSKWMPWELGFKDGRDGKSAILPVAQSAIDSYTGQEYLGIYSYVQKAPIKGKAGDRLWIHTSPKTYVLYEEWLEGSEPRERT